MLGTTARRGVVRARRAAAGVTDPELPMLTLEDLGVLRDVRMEGSKVVATITPTYTGCPAMAQMRSDLARALVHAGFDDVEVVVSLDPPWTTDWISDRGRTALARAGISPPGAAPSRRGPVPLTLLPSARVVRCPQCGSAATDLVSEFGSTACKALYRCSACQEPFDHVKEI